MKQSLTLAMQPSVVKRALKYAVVVGCLLIAINHSDAYASPVDSRNVIFSGGTGTLERQSPINSGVLPSTQMQRESKG
jgi:hypothetical protein